MALHITCLTAGVIAEDGRAEGFEFEVIDTATNEPVKHSVWYEKAKEKSHIKLAKNDANITYISLAKFAATAGEAGEATFEDNTREKRVLGTTDPNAKLRAYMGDDLAEYDEIIGRAKAAAEEAKGKKIDPNSEEGLMASMQKVLAKMSPEARAQLLEELGEPALATKNKKHK